MNSGWELLAFSYVLLILKRQMALWTKGKASLDFANIEKQVWFDYDILLSISVKVFRTCVVTTLHPKNNYV